MRRGGSAWRGRLLSAVLLLAARSAAAETPVYLWGAQWAGTAVADEPLSQAVQRRLAQRGPVARIVPPAQGCAGTGCLAAYRGRAGWLLGVALREVGVGGQREKQGRVWLADLEREASSDRGGAALLVRASLDLRARASPEAVAERAAALLDAVETGGLWEGAPARPRFCGEPARGAPATPLPLAPRERAFVVVLAPHRAGGEARRLARGLGQAAAEHLRHLRADLDAGSEVWTEDPAQVEALLRRRHPGRRGVVVALGLGERRSLQAELSLVGFEGEGAGPQVIGAVDLPAGAADAGFLELQAVLGAKLAVKLADAPVGGEGGALFSLAPGGERCAPFTIELAARAMASPVVVAANEGGRTLVPLRSDLAAAEPARTEVRVPVQDSAPRWPWISGLVLGGGALAAGGTGLALFLLDGRVDAGGGCVFQGVPGACVLRSRKAAYGMFGAAGGLAVGAILVYVIPTMKQGKAKHGTR